ncbi:MAG: ribbon-helix-helix protein, CopG family [Actinobacteria bacterium]|nr:ribbon-helix-helix protein, CopG family [Actinomycetota bacterium]
MPCKTTIYLPDELKLAVEREAARRRCSEAQVIREAVAAAVTRPRPNAGLVSHEPMADRTDELLAGFGER